MLPAVSPDQPIPPPKSKPKKQRTRLPIFGPVHVARQGPANRPSVARRIFGGLTLSSLLILAACGSPCKEPAGDLIPLPPTIPGPYRTIAPPPPLPPGMALSQPRQVHVSFDRPPVTPGLHIERQSGSLLIWWSGRPSMLEWSPDLGSWLNLGPVEAAVVVDADALSQPRRFYRVID